MIKTTAQGLKPLYVIPPKLHNPKDLVEILTKHQEIKFVSFVGIDFAGNDTDEKIPISLFIKDIERILHGIAAQTDGSSVALPGVAAINDARLDMKADLDVNWFIDYNYDHLDETAGFYTGTLRIPVFLIHSNETVDSRAILKNALNYTENQLLILLREHPYILGEKVCSIVFTAATELEFWVKTPAQKAVIEELSASQVMHEQYWQRTRGSVRTALEQAIEALEAYGLGPEMGHKEVGGIKARMDGSGHLSHVLEQLEIDWQYSTGLQTADNELLARSLVKEIFRINGLEVTFQAKPIIGVAGNGEHVHVGIAARLENGSLVNLFSPVDMNGDFLSVIGYGAIMGILKNYEILNPIISATNDSLNRLKPGFEAPVCIVTSLGHTPYLPSRNRTVLAGLIRDVDDPRATRFEIRSPNPFTNTYLALAGLYLSALDGIKFALKSGLKTSELLRELSKAPGDAGLYLEQSRAYRSEEDVFEHYGENERERLFGRHPATVWENMQNFKLYPEKVKVLVAGGFKEEFINGFTQTSLTRWRTELLNKILPEYRELLALTVNLHQNGDMTDLDEAWWEEISDIKRRLTKSKKDRPCLFDRLKKALEEGKNEEASRLQVIAQQQIQKLKDLYAQYKTNNAL